VTVHSQEVLGDQDMPETFRAADQSSRQAQQRFLTLTKVQLVALALAAVFGAFSLYLSGINWAGVIGAICFVIAGLVRAELVRTKPERVWHDGRAVAESAKTLTWRYTVGGQPFPILMSPNEAHAELVRRLRDLPSDLKDVNLSPSVGAVQVTDKMRDLRHSPLEERRQAYEFGRVREQQDWYATKARFNRDRGSSWNRVLLVVEAAGTVGAILRAADAIRVDLLGFSGAVVAGVTAWLQTKQHESLASAYAIASIELASIGELIPTVEDESAWANFVGQAEEAISREHTLWKASRSDKQWR
jgi:SMODS and SLOG-associating 2TM effector domain 3/SMODS and SLOG-associating 2TM effector domain 1